MLFIGAGGERHAASVVGQEDLFGRQLDVIWGHAKTLGDVSSNLGKGGVVLVKHGIEANASPRAQSIVKTADCGALGGFIQGVGAPIPHGRAIVADADAKAQGVEQFYLVVVDQGAVGDYVEAGFWITVTENGRNYLVEAVNNKVRTTIWDGDGNDTHDFSDYRSDLKIQLAPGTWSITSDDQRASKKLGSVTYKAVGSIANAYLFNGDPRSLIENAIGGWGNDIITGNQADNVLTGNAGDDTLDGAVGNDALFGGDGNDKLIGGEGDDTLDGGTGNDVLSGGAGNDVYYVDSASDRVVEGSGPGTDTVYSTVDYSLVDYVENLTLQGQARIGNGNSLNNVIIGNDLGDRLYGGGGNDSLTGGRGADTLDGGDGADRLYGGAGNDMLYGGAGDDNLYGGPGNDTLEGGMGTDVLDGRAGADVFVFRSVNESRANTIVNGVYQDVRDAIVNFDLDQDKIDLSAIDADKTMVRNQQFHFIGAGNFTGQAGELRYDIGTGVVAGDVDGDGIDDFQIYLADRAALTANDFLL